MTQLELLDSARHKLRLARYHAAALVRVLEQHPTEDLDDPLRVAMEAHLEGLPIQARQQPRRPSALSTQRR